MSGAVNDPAPSTNPTGNSYVRRKIDLTITLGKGEFGGAGKNTVKLSGLRVVATVNKATYPSSDSAHIRVYGVQPSIINQISTLGINPTRARQNNYIQIEAGDDTNGMALVYGGSIQNAWQALDDAPETSLNIEGLGAVIDALKPAQPISFPGSADVATVMSGIAARMGRPFENSGVQVKISNPYLSGTLKDQAYALARAANVQIYLDSTVPNGALAIWPQGKTRDGMIPLISAASGLVGYPQYRDTAMEFKCIFNPNIRIGGQVEIRTSVGESSQNRTARETTAAGQDKNIGGPNGIWYVTGPVTYDLASEIPGGPWFTDTTCMRVRGPSK